MNENPSTASAFPPILPAPHDQGPGDRTGTGVLDRTYAALRRLPARDTDHAVVGGVCATLAQRLGVSPVAVRVAAVVAAVVFGVGVGIYLIAWTTMPDRAGRTHLEEGLRHGRGRSLMVLVLGTIAAIGAVFGALSFVAAILPEVIGLTLLVALGWWLVTRLSDRSRTAS